MNDQVEIQESSFEIALYSSVKTPVYLKVSLIVFFCFTLFAFVSTLSRFETHEAKGILGVFVFGGLFVFVVGRFAAWNLWGKERIKITTRSIMYSRSYGLYHVPSRVIVFDYLATNIETKKEYDDIEYGIINFYDRNPATLQLQNKFSSGINLPVAQLKEFEEKVHKLFANSDAGQKWLPFSEN